MPASIPKNMDFGDATTPLVFEIFNERDEPVLKSEDASPSPPAASLEACAFEGRDIHWVTSNVPLATVVHQWKLTFDDVVAVYSEFPSVYDQCPWKTQDEALRRAFEKSSALKRRSSFGARRDALPGTRPHLKPVSVRRPVTLPRG